MSIKTESEGEFEAYCKMKGLSCEKINECKRRVMDYIVNIDGYEVYFEIKQLEEDDNFEDGHIKFLYCGTRQIGRHIRAKIEEARGQVQGIAKQNKPTVLVIYNVLDKFHMFGTEPHDFMAAMYGDYTFDINTNTLERSPIYQDKNSYFQKNRNTSFSALAHLKKSRDRLEIIIYENVYAKVPLNYELIRGHFLVTRVNLT